MHSPSYANMKAPAAHGAVPASYRCLLARACCSSCSSCVRVRVRVRALARANREDVDAGIELLTTGLRLNPAFPEVYNNLANFLRDKARARGLCAARGGAARTEQRAAAVLAMKRGSDKARAGIRSATRPAAAACAPPGQPACVRARRACSRLLEAAGPHPASRRPASAPVAGGSRWLGCGWSCGMLVRV